MIVPTLLALTLLASSSAVPSLPPPEQQIRAALAAWTEAANRGDWKTAASVWAPDLIGWAPSGPDDSYARETAVAQGPPQGVPSTTYSLQVNEVLVDDTMALVRDTWTMTETGAKGERSVSTFRSFEIWRLQEKGTWKIARWIDGPLQRVSGGG